MRFWGTTGKLVSAAAKVAGKVATHAAKSTGHALHGAARWTTNHESEISGTARSVTGLAGRLLKGTGGAIESGARWSANALHSTGANTSNRVGKVMAHASGYIAGAVGGAGHLTAKAGAAVEAASPVVGAVTGGVVTGTTRTLSGALDSVVLTDADFAVLRQRLQAASVATRAQSRRAVAAIEAAQKQRSRKDLLDLLTVGGITLGEAIRVPGKVPEGVQQAFELAYPGLARQGQTFATFVERQDADQLVGVVNAVKGKLFEIELVHHLNEGNLPGGLHAELVASATQPGHDIRIIDAENQVVDLLQAKATESVTYVQQALERYPDVDITTTSEVYARLTALGVSERVHDSGISEAVLQTKVEAATSGLDADAADLLPSVAGLAVLALSSFMNGSQGLEQRGAEFGNRAGTASVASAAGKAVLVATQTWWLGLLVGMGSQWLSTYGVNRRQKYEALRRTVEEVEGLAARRRPHSLIKQLARVNSN